MDQFYFESGFIDDSYFTYIAEAEATVVSTASVSASTTRLIGFHADLNLVASVTTDAQRTLNAHADLNAVPTATIIAGRVVSAHADLNAVPTMTCTLSNIYGADITAFNEASLTAEIHRILESNVFVTSAYTLTADVERTRLYTSAANGVFDLTSNGPSRIRFNEAAIDAAFSLAADFDVIQGMINLDAQASLSINAGYLQETSATLASQVTQTTSADRIRDIFTTLQSNASTTVVAEASKEFFASLLVVATHVVINDRTRDLTSTVNSQFNQTVDNTRLRATSSTLDSTASVSASLGIVKEFACNFNALFSPDAICTAEKNLVAVLDSTTSLTSTATITRTVAASLNVIASQSVIETRIQQASADLTSQATITVSIDGILSEMSATLSSQFTQTTVNDRSRSTPVALLSQATLSCDVKRYRTTTESLVAIASQTVNTRVDYRPSLTFAAIATELAVAVKTGKGLIAMDSQFTATVNAGTIKQFETNAITGIQVPYPVDYIDSALNSLPNTWIDSGAVISLWARKGNTTQTDNSLLLMGNPPGLNYLALTVNSTSVILDASSFDGMATQQPASWINASPNNTEWNHYLILFLNNQTINTETKYRYMQLFVNGVSKGVKYFISSSASQGHELTSPIYLGKGFTDVESGKTYNNFTGDLAQLWIGKFSDYRLVDTTKFYNGGAVDLGTTGTLAGVLPTPWVYDTMDTPFSGKLDSEETGVTTPTAATSTLGLPSITSRFTWSLTENSGKIFGGFWNSYFTQTANAIITASAHADLNAVPTMTVSAVKLKRAHADLDSTTTLQAQISIVGNESITMQSTFTMEVIAQESSKYEAALNANTSLACDITRTRSTSVTVNANCTLSAAAKRFRTITKTLESIATLSVDSIVLVRADAELITSATIACDYQVIQSTRTTCQVNATMQVNAVRTARISDALTAQAQLTTTPTRVRRATANLSAFDTVLAVGLKVVIDPFLTLYIEPEERTLYIIEEDRQLLVAQETSELRIRSETRTLLIPEESGTRKIKGYA